MAECKKQVVLIKTNSNYNSSTDLEASLEFDSHVSDVGNI